MTKREYYTLDLSEGSWDSEHSSVAEALTLFRKHLKICSVCRNAKVEVRVIKHIETSEPITEWIYLGDDL